MGALIEITLVDIEAEIKVVTKSWPHNGETRGEYNAHFI